MSVAPSLRDRIAASNQRGIEAFERADFEGALAAWSATLRMVDPHDDELAPAVHENLGLAFFNLGRSHAAAREFLRAMDGDPAARPQSARLAVIALAQMGHFHHAQSLHATMEAAIGPHPSLTREELAAWAAQARFARRRALPG